MASGLELSEYLARFGWTSERSSKLQTLYYTLFVDAKVALCSAANHTFTITMRLTNTGQLSSLLRSNAGRKLQLAASTHGVRSLTSGTYRVPKAFNEPNVCLLSTILAIPTPMTDHVQSCTSSPTPPSEST